MFVEKNDENYFDIVREHSLEGRNFIQKIVKQWKRLILSNVITKVRAFES